MFCRIFGAILIIVGVYAVLWGQSHEMKLAKFTPEDEEAPAASQKGSSHGGDTRIKFAEERRDVLSGTVCP